MNEQKLAEGRWSLLHAGRNRSKADVHAVELAGRRYAVKDYRRCLWPVRVTVGRWSLSHEARAYERLGGVAGIPEYFGRPHPYLLVTEFVEAACLAEWRREQPLPAGFFARLKELLRGVHDRGVVHGDLHHRDVLVGSGGEVWLVDFSTSLSLRPGARPGWLWRRLAQLDRYAVLKLQERFEPGRLTEAEREELRKEPRAYLWARRMGRRLRDRNRVRASRSG